MLSGARLGGVGTVGATTVNAGAVIAPGNSIGMLTVAGDITFAAGSIYEVEADAAGAADRINASGAANINGGTVRVLAGSGTYAPSTTYTIVTAQGGRTGAFDAVTSNFAFLTPSLAYDANNVFLTLARNGVDFGAIGGTPNQRAAGGGVESLGGGNPVYDAAVQLDVPGARAAFDSLSGEIHASARTALVEDSRFVRNAVIDRVRSAFGDAGASRSPVLAYAEDGPRLAEPTVERLALWASGFGAWGHRNGDGNAARFDRSTGGVLVGADVLALDHARLGLFGGYSYSSFDVTARQSSGSSENYHLGLHGGSAWGALSLRAGLAYAWHDIATRRTVAFAGFADSLKGSYKAGTAQAFAELGYGVQAGALAFEPFANLAYVSLHVGGFREQGGAAALAAGGASTDVAFTTLGARASADFALGAVWATAKGMIGWRHAFGDAAPTTVFALAGGNGFTIAGLPLGKNAAVVEAGLDLALTPTATLGLSYGGQFGSGAADQAVRANFSARF